MWPEEYWIGAMKTCILVTDQISNLFIINTDIGDISPVSSVSATSRPSPTYHHLAWSIGQLLQPDRSMIIN